MASPQIEDGYTRIANELLDAIIRHPFSSREYSIVWALVRATYGYNKKEDAISGWQISDMTGIDRAHVSKTLSVLIAKNIIQKSDRCRISHGQNIYFISINKHYQTWLNVAEKATVQTVAKTAIDTVADSATVAKTAPLPKQPQTVAELATVTVAVLAQPPLPKQPTHKDIPKDIKDIPKDMSSAAEKTADADVELQTACKATWMGYSRAYEQRYFVAPVRNAKVNSNVKQFVKRIGMVEAPLIAAWFVSHQEVFYTRKGHDFGLLLADAEKLRTEWAANIRMNQSQAPPQSVQAARLDVASQIQGGKHGKLVRKIEQLGTTGAVGSGGVDISATPCLIRQSA